jgi:hypothetical protein
LHPQVLNSLKSQSIMISINGAISTVIKLDRRKEGTEVKNKQLPCNKLQHFISILLARLDDVFSTDPNSNQGCHWSKILSTEP